MTSAEMQQVLDETGTLVLDTDPDAVYQYPIFAERDAEVIGSARAIDGFYAGPSFYLGVQRDMIPDEQFTGDGTRLFARSHLWAVGDRWSLLTGVRTMRFDFAYTLHGTTDWHGVGIAGVEADNAPADSGWMDPRPWAIACVSGKVWLYLKTTDGVTRRFGRTIPGGTTTLEVTFTVDLDTGVVLSDLGATTAQPSPLPAGSELVRNMEFGCAWGRLCPFAAAEGYPFSAWPDLTIHGFRLILDGDAVGALSLYPRNGRVPTYTGGPTVPLVPQQPGNWALVVYKTGTSTDHYGGGVSLRNVAIQGRDGSPVIVYGPMLQGFEFDRVRTLGGTRGLTSMMGGVAYPLHLDRCIFAGASDCSAFLYRASGSSISRTQFVHGVRCSLHLLGCSLSVTDCFDGPPGPPSADCTVMQSGGRVRYTDLGSDYEYDPDAAYRLVKVEGRSWDQPWFPTIATLSGCEYRARDGVTATDDQLVSFENYPGYTGRVLVRFPLHAVQHAERLDGPWSPT